MKEIKDLSVGFLDIGIELATNSELLGKVPVVGTFFKLHDIYIKGQKIVLENRLLNFFNQFHDLSSEEKEAFKSKIVSNKDFKDIYMFIISTIDKIDEDGKEKIHGRLFNALIKDDLTLDDFKMLSIIVNKSFLLDVTNFINYYTYNSEESHYLDEYRYNRLMSNGLLNIKNGNLYRQELKNKHARINSSSSSKDDGLLNYELSDLGSKLIKSFQ